MLVLRPLVPSRWDWFWLSSSTPHLRAGLSYGVPAGLEYCGASAAQAVPLLVEVNSRTKFKIKVKGDGQECPSHTGGGVQQLASCMGPSLGVVRFAGDFTSSG
jgi:hypothetical protein